MADSNFDLHGFLNDPKVQADKAGAMKFLQSKGIVDTQGNPIAGTFKDNKKSLPLASDTSDSFIKNLVTSAEDVGTGLLKSGLKTGVGLFNTVQDLGQRIIAGFTKKGGPGMTQAQHDQAFQDRLAEVKNTTGIHASDFTGGRKFINDLNTDKNVGEKTGDIVGTTAQIFAPFAGEVGGLTGLKNDINSFKKPFKMVADYFGNKLKGKSESEILSTTFDKVHTLNASERDVWFKNEQDKINTTTDVETQKVKTDYETKKRQLADNARNNKIDSTESMNAKQKKLDTEYQTKKDEIIKNQKLAEQQAEEKLAQTETKVKENLKSQIDSSTKESEDLKKQLATASRDKVIELRPKIIKAMGEQSKVYRSLIDEELAPHANVKVSQTELKSFIDSQFGDNPGQARAIKDRLGIKDIYQEPTTKTGVPTLNTGEDKTLGEIYNQTKSLKQDISSGARGGSKVFTADDKLTDDAINTLTKFMKTKGVDFSEANSFWAKYAPVRNQLVAEAKPFLQASTQTKVLAGTLSRVAQGADVNNENFIKEVNNLLGENITKENEAIVQKMTTNEKTALANKIDSETQLLDAQMAKEKALNEANKVSESEMNKLEENYTKSKEKLDKAKTDNQNKTTSSMLQNTRKLKDDTDAALKALNDAKAQASKILDSKELEAKRQAKLRFIIRTALGTVGTATAGYIGDKTLKATTGIGY